MKKNPNFQRQIKILIVDDDLMDAELLKKELLKNRRFEIKISENGKQALIDAKKFKPDVAIMDIIMPGMDGIETTEKLIKIIPEIKVIGRSAYLTNARICYMHNAGAVCCLSKSGKDKLKELIEAIVGSVNDGHYRTPKMTEALSDMYSRKVIYPVKKGQKPLNPLEKDYIKWFPLNLLRQQMADKLGRSIRYLEKIKRHVKTKIGAKGDPDIVTYAIENGIHIL